MKLPARVTAAAALLLLAGPLAACTAQTEDANPEACNDFAAAYSVLDPHLTAGRGSMTPEEWRAAVKDGVADLDKASLKATGDVKERISDVVADFPSEPHLILQSNNSDAYKKFRTDVDRVARACDTIDASFTP